MGPENQAREIHTQTEYENNEAYLIGQLLKEAREEKRMTISEVAIETRIRQAYIKALEDGCLDLLPGEIYKVGFLKTYASFLGLDAEEILRRLNLNQEVQVSYAHNKYVIPTESQSQPSKKILYLSIVGALCFSIVAYVAHNSQDADISFRSIIAQRQEGISLTELTPLEGTAELSKGAAAENSIPQSVSPNPASTAQGAIPDKTAETEISAGNSRNKDTTEQSGDSPSITENQSNIILKAVKDTWVQVLDDSGKTIYVKLMHAGDLYSVPDQGKYTLNTGNAGGLKVSYNGQETKILGEEGQILRGVHLTDSGLQSFY